MMENKDFVFLHPTKTGGSSVLGALQTTYRVAKNHLPINSGIISKKNNNKNMLVFATCRNPYDRVLSMYNFFEIAKTMTFGKFLNYLEEKHTQNIFFYPQYKYIQCDTFKVDDILKLENIEEDWKRIINEKLKIPVDMLHLNSEEKIKNTITKKEKSVIYNIYEKDFKVLNYSK